MGDQTAARTYEVHVESNVAEELGIDSPIETGTIDYYDSGIWVEVGDGRAFYPYHNVLTIKERPDDAVQPDGTDAADATDDDRAEHGEIGDGGA